MKKFLVIISIVFTLCECKKNESGPLVNEEPTAVNLIFPSENSLCNVGTDSTETESDVLFEWTAGENTDEYELNLKNLNTGDSIIQSTTELKITLRILRSTPFSWYIVSKSSQTGKTARSKTWKFYNAGEAIENYAPFPAEILSPKMAETITPVNNAIALNWTGSDIDNDITVYDIYFGTTNPPLILQSNVQATTLENITVSINTVYYWYVITKDAWGNSSHSGIYQFKTR